MEPLKKKPETPPPGFQPKRFSLFWIFAIIWMGLLINDFARYRGNVDPIAYSQFLNYVKDGNVSEVVIGPERIDGELKKAPQGKPKGFSALKVEDPQLATRLADAGVKFTGARDTGMFQNLFWWIAMAFLLTSLWGFAISRFKGLGAGGASSFLPLGKSKARVHAETDLKTRFSDVAGVDEAKEELLELVQFLRDPTRFSGLGGRMPKGVLLVGPPGTGKTLMARAVAGEAGVPFFSINGSEFVEMFVGLGAARVRDLFEQARSKAPCIIFIDELDAIGKSRGVSAIQGSANDEKEQTLNQMLAEIDGFDPSIGVVILAATNRPEILDPALLRAGRFDRTVLIDKPDRKGRIQILETHMSKIKAATGPTRPSPEALAGLTTGFSGADLANLVNEAALIATRRKAAGVEMTDFTQAIERIVAGLERKSRVLQADEKRRVAFHEMGHAVVALEVGDGEEVHKVSVIPRGMGALGYTLRRPTEDRYLMSRTELEHKIAIALGGRAAEEIFIGEISTGAADDLDKATDIARAMVARYGMSQKLGLAIIEREQAVMLGSSMPARVFDVSEHTARVRDDEVRDILERALELARATIRRHRAFVDEAGAILLARETLDEGEIKELWKKHAAPLARAS